MLAPRTEGEKLGGPGRPSQEDVLGISPDVVKAAVIEKDPPAFMPTSGMVEAKATYWKMVEEDPTIIPARQTKDQIQLILGDKRFENWTKKAGFLAWFKNKHEHTALAVSLYDKWLRLVDEQMPYMASKDLIALGKILASVAEKEPSKNGKDKAVDTTFDKMDDARTIEYILQTVEALGWKVEIPEGAPGSSLPAPEDKAKENKE